MTNTKFDYVKKFEFDDTIPPEFHIIVRVDGHGFTKMCNKFHFQKPNDNRALDLMSYAARAVMNFFSDIILAYGQSDEYSFLFRKDAKCLSRRATKISTLVASCFSSHYVIGWPIFFGQEISLQAPLYSSDDFDQSDVCVPFFDGRTVAYPNPQVVRDYFSWRYMDCHINNLYNTTFWKLVEIGKDNTFDNRDAELFLNKKFPPMSDMNQLTDVLLIEEKKQSSKLSKTLTIEKMRNIITSLKFTGNDEQPKEEQRKVLSDYLSLNSSAAFKNETLHRFGINYNDTDERHKKGTTIIRIIQVGFIGLTNNFSCYVTIFFLFVQTSIKREPDIEKHSTVSDEQSIQSSSSKQSNLDKQSSKQELNLNSSIIEIYVDIHSDDFWNGYPELLGHFINRVFDPFNSTSKDHINDTHTQPTNKKGKMKKEEQLDKGEMLQDQKEDLNDK